MGGGRKGRVEGGRGKGRCDEERRGEGWRDGMRERGRGEDRERLLREGQRGRWRRGRDDGWREERNGREEKSS